MSKAAEKLERGKFLTIKKDEDKSGGNTAHNQGDELRREAEVNENHSNEAPFQFVKSLHVNHPLRGLYKA